MLAALGFLQPNLPTPVDFECELVLVSTSKVGVEAYPQMQWLERAYEGRPTKTLPPPLESAPALAADLKAKDKPVLVLDGALVKSNPYDPFRSKRLNALFLKSAQNPKNSEATTFTGVEQGGYWLNYTAGPVPEGGPSKSLGWPTFCVNALRAQLSNQDFGLMKGEMDGYRKLALSISTQSVTEAADQIDKADPNYKQICVCAWGTQIPGRPNLIAFPPTGRAVRYKFGHKDGKWFANFVKAY